MIVMEISPERLTQITSRCETSDEVAVVKTLLNAANSSGHVEGVSLHSIAKRSDVDRLALLTILMTLQERRIIVRKKQDPNKPSAWTVMLPRRSKEG